jgi:hypothetical protein
MATETLTNHWGVNGQAARMNHLRKSSQTARQFSPIPSDFLRISHVFAAGLMA